MFNDTVIMNMNARQEPVENVITIAPNAKTKPRRNHYEMAAWHSDIKARKTSQDAKNAAKILLDHANLIADGTLGLHTIRVYNQTENGIRKLQIILANDYDYEPHADMSKARKRVALTLTAYAEDIKRGILRPDHVKFTVLFLHYAALPINRAVVYL